MASWERGYFHFSLTVGSHFTILYPGRIWLLELHHSVYQSLILEYLPARVRRTHVFPKDPRVATGKVLLQHHTSSVHLVLAQKSLVHLSSHRWLSAGVYGTHVLYISSILPVLLCRPASCLVALSQISLNACGIYIDNESAAFKLLLILKRCCVSHFCSPGRGGRLVHGE